MPITITIEGANADEVRQLVQDLAGTIAGMQPEEIPVDTKVSTLERGPAPAGQAVPAAPQQVQAAPTQAPATPSAPVAPPSAGNPVTPVETVSASTAPAAPTQPAPVAPTAAPTTAPQYDFSQLASATMQLQQAGHNIFEIFQQFGITALNQLPKERYAEYAAVLRQRGAKI